MDDEIKILGGKYGEVIKQHAWLTVEYKGKKYKVLLLLQFSTGDSEEFSTGDLEDWEIVDILGDELDVDEYRDFTGQIYEINNILDYIA